jgi:hypothetical protein
MYHLDTPPSVIVSFVGSHIYRIVGSIVPSLEGEALPCFSACLLSCACRHRDGRNSARSENRYPGGVHAHCGDRGR